MVNTCTILLESLFANLCSVGRRYAFHDTKIDQEELLVEDSLLQAETLQEWLQHSVVHAQAVADREKTLPKRDYMCC